VLHLAEEAEIHGEKKEAETVSAKNQTVRMHRKIPARLNRGQHSPST
jgi:hypothetical protein